MSSSERTFSHFFYCTIIKIEINNEKQQKMLSFPYIFRYVLLREIFEFWLQSTSAYSVGEGEKFLRESERIFHIFLRGKKSFSCCCWFSSFSLSYRFASESASANIGFRMDVVRWVCVRGRQNHFSFSWFSLDWGRKVKRTSTHSRGKDFHYQNNIENKKFIVANGQSVFERSAKNSCDKILKHFMLWNPTKSLTFLHQQFCSLSAGPCHLE